MNLDNSDPSFRLVTTSGTWCPVALHQPSTQHKQLFNMELEGRGGGEHKNKGERERETVKQKDSLLPQKSFLCITTGRFFLKLCSDLDIKAKKVGSLMCGLQLSKWQWHKTRVNGSQKNNEKSHLNKGVGISQNKRKKRMKIFKKNTPFSLWIVKLFNLI